MIRCSRCPNAFGCFLKCLYPSASWATNNTKEEEPPEWVKQHERAMDFTERRRSVFPAPVPTN